MQDKHFKGFTLIELMITLSILSVLFLVGIPSFSKLISDSRQSTLIRSLYSQHQMARSEAIKRNTRITLCKSNNGQQCSPTSDWHDGWIMFTDNHSKYIIDADDIILHVQQDFSPEASISYRGFGSHNAVSYYANGMSTSNGTFTLCLNGDNHTAKALIVSRTGRMRISEQAANGDPLNCI